MTDFRLREAILQAAACPLSPFPDYAGLLCLLASTLTRTGTPQATTVSDSLKRRVTPTFINPFDQPMEEFK